MTQVPVGDLVIGNDRPLTVIAGPCALETEDHAHMIAEAIAPNHNQQGDGAAERDVTKSQTAIQKRSIARINKMVECVCKSLLNIMKSAAQPLL